MLNDVCEKCAVKLFDEGWQAHTDKFLTTHFAVNNFMFSPETEDDISTAQHLSGQNISSRQNIRNLKSNGPR